MDIGKTYKSTEAELKGRWFEEGDARFLVASINSPAYKAEVQARLEQERGILRRAERRNAPSEIRKKATEVKEKITREAMAAHILLGWENVQCKGEELEYSAAKASQMLNQFPKFADMIAEFAMDEFSDENEADQEGIETLGKD